MKKGPRRYDTLDMPLNLEVFAIGNGAVKMRWRRVAHAKSYAVEYCKDVMTEDAWHNGTYNSAASATVVGLLPLHKYFFRVRAMGSESMKSVYSDVALTVVV
ncbi:MAG: fibronectin type III domain-containing protein [Sphingobacteriales bacterium]|nr:MAG: fibronectin type III domain-containing protein [Sphingobacteriales bacterium]